MAKLTDRGTILVLFCSASLTWRFARDAFAAPLLTVRDVAALRRVSTRTVYLLCAQGRLPMIQGTVLVGAFFIVIANLIVDILYAVIDPRVRYS